MLSHISESAHKFYRKMWGISYIVNGGRRLQLTMYENIYVKYNKQIVGHISIRNSECIHIYETEMTKYNTKYAFKKNNIKFSSGAIFNTKHNEGKSKMSFPTVLHTLAMNVSLPQSTITISICCIIGCFRAADHYWLVTVEQNQNNQLRWTPLDVT